MLITDDATSGGLLMSSEDGLTFDYYEGVPAFGSLKDYVPAEKLDSAPCYRAPKFERPQLLLKDGIPTHLYAPCGTNINGGKGTCCYLFAINQTLKN